MSIENGSITIKAKSGLNQFQDQNEYRKWFTILFPLIQSRASAQANQATELFTYNWAASYENGDKDDDGLEGQGEDLSNPRTDKNLDATENMGTKILVPVKRSTNLHRNKDQISSILKGKFRYYKREQQHR